MLGGEEFAPGNREKSWKRVACPAAGTGAPHPTVLDIGHTNQHQILRACHARTCTPGPKVWAEIIGIDFEHGGGAPRGAPRGLRGGLPRARGARARDRRTTHAFPTLWGTGGGTGGRARAFGRAQAPPIWNSGGSGRGGAPPRLPEFARG